jgi:hypothetical protein
MLTARQNDFLRSCYTAAIQKADATRSRVFPDPREKPASRPTVTAPKPRDTAIPRFIVQSFRTGRSECDPFGDLAFAMRHASLNAPSYVWPADRVTIKDGVVSTPKGERPLAQYA